MKLTFEQIKSVTRGVAEMVQTDSGIDIFRFTEAQREAYKNYKSNFHMKSFASAGVRMEFFTSSKKLVLTGECTQGSSRMFFGFDVYVEGHMVAHLIQDLGEGFTPFRLEADLGEEENKAVTIYFPWSARTRLHDVELDDDATLVPIERDLKMICFGDSITHGYRAKNPSFSYVARLADALRADVINKGIGAEVFFPTLAALKDDYEPDIITVAYGTNDWSNTSPERFEQNAPLFYKNLAQNYPNAKIFALAPIWRKDCHTRVTEIGSFEYIAEKFREIAKDIPNMTVIDCFSFVPPEGRYFMKDLLHPNDEGFLYYAFNLYNEIKKHL